MVHNNSECHVNRKQVCYRPADVSAFILGSVREGPRDQCLSLFGLRRARQQICDGDLKSHIQNICCCPFQVRNKSDHKVIHWYYIALSHIMRKMSISQWFLACLTISTPELVPMIISLVMVIQWLKTIESNWASCAYHKTEQPWNKKTCKMQTS